MHITLPILSRIRLNTALGSVYYLSVLLSTALLESCGIEVPHPQLQPDAIPPQIVITGDERLAGWDRPSAFGAVPPELQAKGEEFCKANGALGVLGYHAQARNVDGKTFTGGGFFCKF